MQRPALIIIAVVLVITACNVAQDATAPQRPMPGEPALDFMMEDCQLSESECMRLFSGIEYLQGHANQSCMDVGNSARYRFDAPSGVAGYARGDNQNTATGMYVGMVPSSTTYSGYQHYNEYTYVNDIMLHGGFSQAQIGSSIAHEEIHHTGMDGPGHNTQVADAYYTACMNPQA